MKADCKYCQYCTPRSESDSRYFFRIRDDSKTDTNKVLISSIFPRRDNLNGKGGQVNMFLTRLCMEKDFVFVNHDNLQTRQHCNYSLIHLGTLGSKILADSFILVLNTLT